MTLMKIPDRLNTVGISLCIKSVDIFWFLTLLRAKIQAAEQEGCYVAIAIASLQIDF